MFSEPEGKLVRRRNGSAGLLADVMAGGGTCQMRLICVCAASNMDTVQRQVADVGGRRRRIAGGSNEALPAFVLMSRVVLALMGLLLVVMPWSERYSMLDNFPHGQDTEVGCWCC